MDKPLSSGLGVKWSYVLAITIFQRQQCTETPSLILWEGKGTP